MRAVRPEIRYALSRFAVPLLPEPRNEVESCATALGFNEYQQLAANLESVRCPSGVPIVRSVPLHDVVGIVESPLNVGDWCGDTLFDGDVHGVSGEGEAGRRIQAASTAERTLRSVF